MVEVTKQCNGCDQQIPRTGFHKRARTKDRLQSRCKQCQKDYTYGWRSANPEAAAKITKRHYEKDGRGAQYRRLYGISSEEVIRLSDAQGNQCAICARPASEALHGRLHVDHDHATKAVRGLLYMQCNTALGKFEDSPALLRAAIHYLETAARTERTTS